MINAYICAVYELSVFCAGLFTAAVVIGGGGSAFSNVRMRHGGT